jgi:hypothetical protein
MGRSLVQRSPIECGVSEYDRRISYMRVRFTVAVEPWTKIHISVNILTYGYNREHICMIFTLWFSSCSYISF